MLASTNHCMYTRLLIAEIRSRFLQIFTNKLNKIVDLLDPGIAKRPSRFDRKYLFPLPSVDERVQYCEYWRSKLKSNNKIEFPKRLTVAIAEITDKFSFAYMKEAFVAALLALRHGRNATHLRYLGGGDDDLDGLPLWREMKKQVKNLRAELGAGDS